MKYLLLACRPKQWTKNLIVFAAPFFSFSHILDVWISSFVCFISFCLISSSIYLINDSIDIKSDKQHPSKKFRPIASGLVSIKRAIFFSIILFISSILIAFSVNKIIPLIIIFYFLLQIFYCFKLKNEPIIDIFCISSGFLIRSIAGVKASNLDFSPWFLLSIGLLALFLAIEKRKAELQTEISLKIKNRKSLERYSLSLLMRIEPIVTTSAFMSYSLWAINPNINGVSSGYMIFSIPFVLIGIFRYQFITDPKERKRREIFYPNASPEKPEEILLSDKGIILSIMGWLITIAMVGLFS